MAPSCRKTSPDQARGPERVELDSVPAEAESQGQPVVAEELHGCGIFGQPKGVVKGRQEHSRTDPDAAGRRRQCRTHDEQRRHVAIVDEVVLTGPDGVVSEPLRRPCQLDGVVVGASPARLTGPELRAQQPETETHANRSAC